MLVSLNPKPVFYSLQPRANTQYNESGAVSKRPLPLHQNNPTAGDRGATEQGKQTKRYGKRGGNKGGRGICKIKLQPRLHLTVLRNVKPWILSANVQDEVQTISILFILKRMLWLFNFIIQDFQRQTEFLQPN